MMNGNILRNIVQELRRDEEILCVEKKCIWNFIYVFIIFLGVSVICSLISTAFLPEVFSYFHSYSLNDFTPEDIVRFLGIIFLFLFFIGPWAFVIFALLSFCKNELVITDQRLIFLNFGKIIAFERNEIIGIDSDRSCDKSFIRSVVISTKKENLQKVGKPETLWNQINNIQTFTFLFYNHKKLEENLKKLRCKI